jgi:hypothetical protein
MPQIKCIYVDINSKFMKLNCPVISRVFIMGVVFAVPFIFADSASAQNQNMTPSMVINMSDLSIKVGNTTSNETITFSNNTTVESENSSR